MSDNEKLLNRAGNARGMHTYNDPESRVVQQQANRLAGLASAAAAKQRTLEDGRKELARARKMPVTPQDVQAFRRRIMDVVEDNVGRAQQVLEGTEVWTNAQVRVFSVLLNKVVPDLHHSYSEVSVQKKKLDDLTREELEGIIRDAMSEKKKSGEVIDVEPKETGDEQ